MCINKVTSIDSENSLSHGRHHYVNQSRDIGKWDLMNKLQWNFNQNSYIFIQEKCILKCCLENGDHFVLVLMHWAIAQAQQKNKLDMAKYIPNNYILAWCVSVYCNNLRFSQIKAMYMSRKRMDAAIFLFYSLPYCAELCSLMYVLCLCPISWPIIAEMNSKGTNVLGL